jgi:hypothetical protein
MEKMKRNETNKSKLVGGMLALSLALPLAIATGNAQQAQPSSKVTAKTANLTLLPKTDTTGDWQTVLANSIKTANKKDLFITASLEVGLFTETQPDSVNNVSDSSFAQAIVQVRVLLDGNVTPVEPGVVVYDNRAQSLTTQLEGSIGSCLAQVINSDGSVSIIVTPGCGTPETINLILDTLHAASFGFVAVDVPQGVHTISVQARIDTHLSAQTGHATALGLVGKATMTVESVRLIKDPSVPLDVN